MFHIIDGVKNPNVNISSTTGFMRSDQLICKRCSGCNIERPPQIKMIQSNDGKFFCGPECAKRIGYIRAMTIEGRHIFALKGAVFSDAVLPDSAWTTLEVARVNGALPYVVDIDDELDEEIVSVNGRIISKDNVFFRLNQHTWDVLVRQGKLIQDSKQRYSVTDEVVFIENNSNKCTASIKRQHAVELDDSHKLFAA